MNRPYLTQRYGRARLRTVAALLIAATVAGPVRADRLMLCFGYGCRHSQAVELERADWARLGALFPADRTPAREREAIAAAVAAFERLAGAQTPIHRDRAGNPVGAPRPGQLDCIDESLNTTAFLILLEGRGLLRWHRVIGRAYRAPLILDQHWSAQIEEIPGGGRFVVDAWPADNGQPPLIQPVGDWLAKRPVGETTAMPGAELGAEAGD